MTRRVVPIVVCCLAGTAATATASGLTAAGTYQITITGTSGAVQQRTTVSLTVQ